MKNLIPFLFVFGLVLIGYQKGYSQENSVPEIEPVDWPVYRGDNSRAGFVSAELQTKKLEPKWQWTAEVPPQPAWDGPARWDAFAELRDLPAMRQYDACFHTVSDGEKLYFGSSSQDALIALDIQTGEEIWAFLAGGPIRLAPTLSGEKILFGCDDGFAYCLDRATGQLIWKFSPSLHLKKEQRRVINNDRLISFFPVRTGVLVRDDIAYFAASFLPWRESFLCGVNLENGKVGMSDRTFVTEHDNATLEGSLLVAGNRLIIPQGRISPLLFDRTNGSRLGNLPGGGGVTIVLTEDGNIVRTEGGRASRPGQVGVFNGKERIASFPRGRSIVVRKDFFFVIDGQKLFAAKRMTNELVWEVEVDEPLELIMVGESLIVGGRDHVTAVDSQDGAVSWSAKTDGRVFGLSFANQTLVASTDKANIYAYSPTAKTEWKPIRSEAAARGWESPLVLPVREKQLLHRWVFHGSAIQDRNGDPALGIRLQQNFKVKDQAGAIDLSLSGKASRIRIGDSKQVEGVEFQGGFFPINSKKAQSLPSEAISIEAWVRVDQPTQWGGIVGCIQDDGATEHGWLLGYSRDRFSLAIAGSQNGLTYLKANTAFQKRKWYHVVGTYNGKEMRLYVDGVLAASSQSESGPISYSKQCFFSVARYLDANESYPLEGALHEVRIYATAIDASQIGRLYAKKSVEFEFEEPAVEEVEDFVAWGPISRYVRPGVIEIKYGTHAELPSVVDLISPLEVKQLSKPTLSKTHQVTISDLPFRRELQFQIRKGAEPTSESSTSFPLDTHFDWAGPPIRTPSPLVKNTLAVLPNPRGMAVLVGKDQIKMAEDLSRESQLTVVLRVAEESFATEIRKKWWKDKTLTYGLNLCVTTLPVQQMPAASALLVSGKADLAELRRLVRPDGGVLINGSQVVWKRDPLPGAGSWSHMYGRADNSAYGGEDLANASNRDDLVTQWIGRPGPRYQTDRQNRKPSPLAVGGRLFLQGQQRMIALDSYSGNVLWSVESPTVMRWNVPHDCSNWCADESGVYVAAESQAWLIDGPTGTLKKQYGIPGTDAASKNWGYIARHKNSLLGTGVNPNAIYTKWWGSSHWFDSTGGPDTHVVAGDFLFSLDNRTGNLQWKHDGLVLHPTITIQGNQIFFIQDETVSHIKGSVRRISLEAGQSYSMVCLDISTGAVVWRRPIKEFSGHVASLYLACGGNEKLRRLVLVASESSKKQFSVQTFELNTGSPLWDRWIGWEANHHGKHISRPALEGDLLYIRPEVLQLADGKTIQRGFPGGHGCSSYTLSTNGLFSRLGETTWWDIRNEKVNRFSRIRTDCWISAVPAQGMLLSAEGGGGCSCGSWLETSLGFLPRRVDDSYPSPKPNPN